MWSKGIKERVFECIFLINMVKKVYIISKEIKKKKFESKVN